jgi:hypothetical protein
MGMGSSIIITMNYETTRYKYPDAHRLPWGDYSHENLDSSDNECRCHGSPLQFSRTELVERDYVGAQLEGSIAERELSTI